MRAYVNSGELRKIFTDIALIYKSSDKTRVVGVSTTKDTITFTVDVGVIFQSTIGLYNVEQPTSVRLSILFKDIQHFITLRHDVQIELSEHFFTLNTGKAAIQLQVGVSSIADYNIVGGQVSQFNGDEFNKVVKLYSLSADLQKAYQKDYMLTFYGDTVIMRSPTIWIRTNYTGVSCVLSLSQVKTISAFKPSRVDISDRLEFHSSKAVMSFPRIAPSDTDDFDNYCKDMVHLSTFNLSGVLSELAEIKRAIGVTNATVYLYEKGFLVDITKDGVTLRQAYGTEGAIVKSFRMMFDLFVMVLNMLSSEVNVCGKEDVLLWENRQGLSILTSV